MPRLTDDQQRAVESIDKHVLVSAGAGCGKTMVLVERYLQVLDSYPDASVSDIIAVTFTRKAAEEMRSRLKARVREKASGSSSEAQRWLRVLGEVDRARIATIHSLCESILKAHPAEAGVDPQFEILDDLSRVKLLHETADAALRDLLNSPQAETALLLEYPVETVKQWIVKQLESAPQYLEARAAIGELTIENLRSRAHQFIECMGKNYLQTLADDRQFRAALRFLASNSYHDSQSALECKRREALSAAQDLSALLNQGQEVPVAQLRAPIERLAALAPLGTAGGAKGKPIRDAINTLRNSARQFVQLCPAGLNEQDEPALALLRDLLRLIDTALQRFAELKNEQQKLDYNDLIMKTHALLRASDTTSRRFAGGLKALLVDEFQDTNGVQAQLLSALCTDGCRLFLIGDDKQSIYKFQGADVSTFNAWKQSIGNQSHGLPGEGLLLDLNFSFRSHPSIVAFVNRFFAFHFQAPASNRSSYCASPQALVAAREEPHESTRVEVVAFDALQTAERPDFYYARTMEARAVAAWVLDKVEAGTPVFDKSSGQQRPIEFGDIAVLVQTNADFAAIETALARCGIPYVTFAGAGFLHRQEILDIENMLRWLSGPEDDHALLAVLRSPFFSINDGIIHKVFLAGAGTLWQRVQVAARQADYTILRRTVAILRQLLEESQRCTIADLVRKVIALTSFDITLLAVPNGKQKARNVWKMAAFAGDYNHLSVTEFVASLEAMRELGAGMQTDAPLAAENAVKLMTIHKSKGLEFPAVILPVLGRKIHQAAPKLLVHRDFGIALDNTRNRDDLKPAYYACANLLNAQMEAEEKKRLLYVGMTRARDYLAMFIQEPARNETSFRLWIKQALALEAVEEQHWPAGLAEGTDYTVRYLDEPALSDWEGAVSALSGTFLSCADVHDLSEEIGFDLLQPLSALEDRTDSANVSWTSLARATASGVNDEPHATILGNLFHAVMQRLVVRSHRPTEDEIRRLIASDEIAVADVGVQCILLQECLRLLNIYHESGLCERIATARRFLPEVSYAVFDRDGGCIHRRPDLIFQDEADEWQIVDFKTDKMTVADIAAKVNEHSAQVLDYVDDFRRLTNLSAQGWLYFAELGLLEPVKEPGHVVSGSG